MERNEDGDGETGLSTEEAFDRLIQELTAKLCTYTSAVHKFVVLKLFLFKVFKDLAQFKIDMLFIVFCFRKSWQEIIRSSFSTTSVHANITWTTLLVLFIHSFVIFLFYCFNYSPRYAFGLHMVKAKPSFLCIFLTWNFRWTTLVDEGVLILFLLLFNVGIAIWYNYKRVNEIPVKLEKIIYQLKGIPV